MGLNEAARAEAGTAMFACDSHPESGSPKDLEQWHRSQGREVTAHRETRGRKHKEPTEILSPKPLRDFLGDGRNKTAMVELLEEEVLAILNAGDADAQRYSILERCILINSHGLESWVTIERGDGGVWKVTSRSGPKLQWIEADQLIPICVKWWNTRPDAAGSVVCCEDADVHVALFLHEKVLASGKAMTLVKTAGGDRRHLDVVGSMRKFEVTHGKDKAATLGRVLMGVCCATGCDTDGCPHGSPKTTVWSRLLAMLETHPALFDALAKVGQHDGTDAALADPDQESVRADLDHAHALLLGCSNTSKTCDEFKGRKMKKTGLTELKRMPPTTGSVTEQWARGGWQAGTWNLSITDPEADPPDPLRGERGCERRRMVKGDKRTDMVGPTYTKRGMAPEEMLKAPGCGCDKGGTAKNPHHCVTEHCPCFDAGVTCTDNCRCRCAACQNREADQQNEQSDNEEGEPATSALNDELAEHSTARRERGGDGPPTDCGTRVGRTRRVAGGPKDTDHTHCPHRREEDDAKDQRSKQS